MSEKHATLTVERLPLSALQPHPKNPRNHPEQGTPAWETLRKSLAHDYFDPMVWNKRNGMLVSGHLRRKVLEAEGFSEADCVIVDYDEETHLARMLAANRLQGEDDDAALAAILGDLEEAGFDLDLTGFDAEALEELDLGGEEEGTQDAEAQIDRAAELQEKWGTERGQVWELGEHRLMCGDSTSKEDVERLMAGERCDLCFTSPPYGVGEDSAGLRDHITPELKKRRSSFYDSHADNPEGWPKLMDEWWAQAVSKCDAIVVNVQLLARNKRDLLRWVFDRTDALCDVAIWNKGHGAPQMQERIMNNAFEFLFIFSPNNASRTIPLSNWRGCIQSVYGAPGQKDNEISSVHAATMPTHLPMWVIGELCNLAQSIYEPFSGSGTTLIACENLHRRCRAMEISPAYVAVAIQRFQDATGKTPKLLV